MVRSRAWLKSMKMPRALLFPSTTTRHRHLVRRRITPANAMPCPPTHSGTKSPSVAMRNMNPLPPMFDKSTTEILSTTGASIATVRAHEAGARLRSRSMRNSSGARCLRAVWCRAHLRRPRSPRAHLQRQPSALTETITLPSAVRALRLLLTCSPSRRPEAPCVGRSRAPSASDPGHGEVVPTRRLRPWHPAWK